MRLSFDVLSLVPLGKQLANILERLSRSPLLPDARLSLFSRGGRGDLAREAIVDSAARSAFDYCHVKTSAGEIQVHWSYGPNARTQSISGTLTADSTEIPAVRDLVVDLCEVTRAVYAYADLKRLVDQDVQACRGELFHEDSLFGVYWLNWFGAEFRLPAETEAALRGLAELEARGGARLLILADEPGREADKKRPALAAAWPIFRKYDPGARMTPALALDYRAVRALEAAPAQLASAGSIVGDVDAFLANVEQHAESFRRWAAGKGLKADRPEDFRTTLSREATILEDERELLIGAIAAYGEVIRAASGGEWKKSRLFREPVVKRTGRPWTTRRVVVEVLKALHPGD